MGKAGLKESSEAQIIQWSGLSDVGRFRKNNQDAFLALALNGEGVRRLGKYGKAELNESDYIYAVSDGMGGANSGEFASRIAVETITSSFPKYFRNTGTDSNMRSEALTQLFRTINSEMNRYGESYPECKGMGATLSMCWLIQRRMSIAHIGDSRIYHLKINDVGEKSLLQITNDDNRVATLLKDGKISEYEARNHPMKNMLTRALGANNQFVDPEIRELDVRKGEKVFICSDGVTDGICLLYTSPSPRDRQKSRMPSSA